MSKFKVIVTAQSFGNTDRKAYDFLVANGCEVKKLAAQEGSIAEQLKLELSNADAVIAGLESYDAALIAQAKQLKVISRYGVGFEKVDLEVSAQKGIIVTTTPGANGDSVADLAVGLMLDCARNITYMNNRLKEKSRDRPSGLEMWQKTLGVVGAGRIGQGVARRCRGFDMKILCFDKYQDKAFKEETGAQYVDFETLIRQADFITIHSPLTPETKNMFSVEQFKVMKNTAVLVNTARGGIVDEDALFQALKSGQIHGAGLDATILEPPFGSPLIEATNCILTPHAGAATSEAISKMSMMAAQNALDVLMNGSCKFSVN